MPEFVPAKFCNGCGYPIILLTTHKVLKEMGKDSKAILGLDIGCSLLAWNFLPINTFQTHHGRVTPTMLGYKRARPETTCLGYTGDGGAYAIGLQSLLYAARRDEPITIFVINNAVYGMTSGQTAPTTLVGQKTDTDPIGNVEEPFLGPELIAQVVKPGAFVARTSMDNMKEMQEFFKKAFETQDKGHFSLVEVLSLCPTNWKTDGPQTIAFLKEKMKPVFKVGIIKS